MLTEIERWRKPPAEALRECQRRSQDVPFGSGTDSSFLLAIPGPVRPVRLPTDPPRPAPAGPSDIRRPSGPGPRTQIGPTREAARAATDRPAGESRWVDTGARESTRTSRAD